MVCIYCGAETSVINSRPQKRYNNIWRRRQCGGCGAVFTTSETPDFLKSLVVTNGNSLEPFSRDKLFLSVHDSVRHRKTATSDATGLTGTIISRLYPFITSGSLARADITHIAAATLKRFDKAAASHYRAYHP